MSKGSERQGAAVGFQWHDLAQFVQGLHGRQQRRAVELGGSMWPKHYVVVCSVNSKHERALTDMSTGQPGSNYKALRDAVSESCCLG